jgi:transposase
MDKLQAAIAKLHSSATPKSALGKASTYSVRQWRTPCVFFDDARVPISNTLVARQQRRIAIGGKSYLFSGSDEGARRLSA